MDPPGSFAGVACHSGDLGFDLAYGRDLVTLVSGLDRYNGNIGAFMQEVTESVKVTGKQIHLMMLLGMAATYSADPASPDGHTRETGHCFAFSSWEPQ